MTVSFVPASIGWWVVRDKNPYGYEGYWHLNENFDRALDLMEDSLRHGCLVIAPGINPSVASNGGSAAQQPYAF